ncbi:MAG: DUF4142 domain-containing protein [Acidobacteria bacterium]|nr:DUF4142 domain-containing protein [Acidobacteriota bacterium]
MIKRLTLLAVLTMLIGGVALTQQTIGQATKPVTSKDSKPQKETKAQEPAKMHEHHSATAMQGEMKASSMDHHFVMMAAEGGNAEVELGQLALSKASSEAVKQFAQRMVDDHGKANAELAQLAQSKGITIALANDTSATTVNPDPDTKAATEPTTPDPMKHDQMNQDMKQGKMNPDTMKDEKMQQGKMNHDMMRKSSGQKMSEKLAKLSGADFDREYMKYMVEDHVKDVAMFEKEAKTGKDADIKAFAEKTLPTLKEHLQMARDTNAKVSGKPKEKP